MWSKQVASNLFHPSECPSNHRCHHSLPLIPSIWLFVWVRPYSRSDSTLHQKDGLAGCVLVLPNDLFLEDKNRRNVCSNRFHLFW